VGTVVQRAPEFRAEKKLSRYSESQDIRISTTNVLLQHFPTYRECTGVLYSG